VQFTLGLSEIPDNQKNNVHNIQLIRPYKTQLLKWIGSKQRIAHEIISFFPKQFEVYHEPFLGSGGVLAVLAPKKAEAADSFKPLVEIWNALKHDPDSVKRWYSERWESYNDGNPIEEYEKIKASYNKFSNGPDLLFLSRSCYGGVIRFRKKDGYMSTPCGVHTPILPAVFSMRVDQWHARVKGTNFFHREYGESIDRARNGDVVYCDPPYSYSQAILYGAQNFALEDLFRNIEKAKSRGVFVALSIDGSKKSGNIEFDFKFPKNLFSREVSVNLGRSMLRRFQMGGQTLEDEIVTDRLLLTH
jgi:DNA adenine methylase